MKKIVMMLVLASVCFMSAIMPARASDGIIIVIRPVPSPTPTPTEDTESRSAGTTSDMKTSEFPSFWEFLSYFGL